MESRTYVSTTVLPKRKRKIWRYVAVSALVVFVFSGSWVAFTFDWELMREAVPPEIPRIVSVGPVKVLSLQIQDVNILESPLIVSGGQPVEVRGYLQANVDEWRWSSLSGIAKINTVEESDAYDKAHAYLPRLDVRVQLRSKTSKLPGFVVDKDSILQRRPRDKDRVEFQGPLWIPPRPGTYEFCLYVIKKPSDQKSPGEEPTEYVMTSTHITVLPAVDAK